MEVVLYPDRDLKQCLKSFVLLSLPLSSMTLVVSLYSIVETSGSYSKTRLVVNIFT